MSVRNQVLGSLTNGPETKMDMYRVFLKYSKTKISYDDWEKYNQMIIFSPMELCGAGLALTSQPVTLSISFDIERTACDTLYNPRDYAMRTVENVANPGTTARVHPDGRRWAGKGVNFTSTLWFLHQEAVQLSSGQCGVELLTFSPQEANAAFASAAKTLEEPVLEQFVQ